MGRVWISLRAAMIARIQARKNAMTRISQRRL